MEALRVERLRKTFGGVQALQDVSFGVEIGERLALIGPNGAGKTTLLNLISGELFPNGGRIHIFGHEVTMIPIYRRTHLGLARSFQLNKLFFNLTILDNILLALQALQPFRFQPFRSIFAYKHLFFKAQELLEPMGLWERKDIPVSDLSYGGQRQVELVLSLAAEPKLLLLDEPSAGLSAEETADMITMIRNLGQDITTLVVAHDMDVIFGLADRIIVLHYGKVMADGTPEEIQANSVVKEIYMGIEESTGDA